MPAKFRPELVPEELMAPVLTVSIWLGVIAEWFFHPILFMAFLHQSNVNIIQLQLTVEEYVQTMEKLTTDMRFTLFNICYKRILVIWITLAFVILLSLLFSGFVVSYERK